MAREYAPIRLSIWDDDDFRRLSGDAKLLYFVLLTHPSLTHCGVADWRPKRLATLIGPDWTAERVEQAAAHLQAELYVLVDESTEEVLVRSFIRHDGLMKQPNMAVAMVNARAAVASATIRGVIVHEVRRLAADQPDLTSWGAKASKDLLAELMARDAVDPSTYPLGNPSGKGSPDPSGNPSGKGFPKGPGDPSGNPSPTPRPSPAPTTSNLPAPSEQAQRKRRAPTNTSTPEARIANLVAEHSKGATPWTSSMNTAKRALRISGATEENVAQIMCALYDAGKPLTTTLIGQVLAGSVVLNGPPQAPHAGSGSTTTDRVLQAQSLKRGTGTGQPVQLPAIGGTREPHMG
jgi:hypothetical protein